MDMENGGTMVDNFAKVDDVDKVDKVDTNIDPGEERSMYEEPDYRELRIAILERLPSFTGWFDSAFIDKEFNILTSTAKKNRHKILERLVGYGKLEKNQTSNKYRRVEGEVAQVDWLNVNLHDKLKIRFPVGADGTGFEFADDLIIYPKDIIVFAGESNKGKSMMAYNIMVENMDSYKVRLMGNELEPHKFAGRMKWFTWKELLDKNGNPKFEVVRRLENHKDIILPDAINIIDWLNMEGDFWKVSKIMEGIAEKLNRGIAVICLQKSEGKDIGRGGDFSKDMASVYLSISDGILKVEKVKSWEHNRPNPNGTYYRFKIVNSGSRITNIQKVVICEKCSGKGRTYKGEVCSDCYGNKYIDVGEPYRPDPVPDVDDRQLDEMLARR